MARRPMRTTGWIGLLLLLSAGAARADGIPEWLPRYDVDVVLDVHRQFVRVCEDVTWVNRGSGPVGEIVFNAHAAYKVPAKDIGLLAKMLEILRMTPREALSLDGPALTVEGASVRAYAGKPYKRPPDGQPAARAKPSSPDGAPVPAGVKCPVPVDDKALAFRFDPENHTALILRLPEPVEPGQSVTVRINFTMKLPGKKGRWGQWDGVTALCQWLPVVAVHDDKGFHATPFIPWHQPFYNEAGHYTVRVVLPCDQKLAGSSAEKRVVELGDGWKAIEFEPACLRDFALVASSRFKEWWSEADGVKVRCLAFPEHEFYAKVMLDACCKAIPVYNHWFGRYPYPQFTIVEACFGWNGNECGGLVMIDDRMFRMPHLAAQYPTYLVQHELCHQWWYNVVGTNGYAETWMDEGPATYFSHRLNDKLTGVNNQLLEYPKFLSWMPNIHREDLRNYSYIGARKRGDIHPTVQSMEKYEHLVNLSAAAYDRGSKVIGMIEERLGEAAFLDFMRHVYRKYQFRILRVRDFQHELEEMTGRSWEDFFQQWVYGTGMCDWSVERVEINGKAARAWLPGPRKPQPDGAARKVVVYLKQTGGFNEPTVLGIRFKGQQGYQMRIPIYPDVQVLRIDDATLVECRTSVDKKNKDRADVRVELLLPVEPEQITVDPDRILLDDCPTNNHWKAEQRWRLTPLYTELDDTDVTNSYDRWNFAAGPWIFGASYIDPWFTRTSLIGFRAGTYRTQEFYGGAYVGYRTDDRNVVAGVDGLWDHVILPQMQVGFTVERALLTLGPQAIPNSRAVAYARYVLMYGDSLYLPPFHYVETFAFTGNRGLPDPRYVTPDADPFNSRTSLGAHWHLNLLTPYWDAEGGVLADLTYQYGMPILGNQRSYQELFGQVSFVQSMPRVFDWLGQGPALRWLNDTRFAFRAGGATAQPGNGEFFSLGGADRFRGFGLNDRQASSIWVGSVEWRLPILQNLDWDYCDHVAGLRNVYLAPFYDVGDAYLKGQASALGDVAQAVGLGVRLDVVWLGMIERTTLRLDVAKTLNGNTPTQFWVGMQHPF